MTGLGEIVVNETERMAALRELGLLDTPREDRFDRITRTAQRVLQVPIALITLVDVERQWFKSCQGLGISETPRSASFCAHAIGRDDIMVVPDARRDPRFVENPLVLGSPFIRFYAGKPLKTSNGQPVGTLCVIDTEPRELTDADSAALTDLGAWAELEFRVVTMSRAVAERDELRGRVEQLKDEIISVTGHELRTPLTGIRGSLGLLAAGAGGPLSESGVRLVETAERNADRLIRLVNDMLDVERLAAGRMPMREDRVDLREVAVAALDVVAPIAAAASVELRTEIVLDAAVIGDRDRLVQVVSNLVDNAIKFSPAGSAVTVSLTTEGTDAVLLVRDEGAGMAPEQLGRIFDRFAQLDTGDNRSSAGSGLGLAIVRGIVEAHHGAVEVTSRPGGGSLFTIRLPRVDAAS